MPTRPPIFPPLCGTDSDCLTEIRNRISALLGYDPDDARLPFLRAISGDVARAMCAPRIQQHDKLREVVDDIMDSRILSMSTLLERIPSDWHFLSNGLLAEAEAQQRRNLAALKTAVITGQPSFG